MHFIHRHSFQIAVALLASPVGLLLTTHGVRAGDVWGV